MNLSGRQPHGPPELIAEVIARLAAYRTDRRTYRHWGPRHLAREYGTTEQTVLRWARGCIPKRYRGLVDTRSMPAPITDRPRALLRYGD